MRDDLSQALSAVHDDSDVRALLITGQGRAFCAGADLTEFGAAPSQTVARRVRWERDVWGQLLEVPVPVVAAVHGYCIGSGIEIALLCDIRIGAQGAVFAMPEVQLGMIPAAGGTQMLPRITGWSSAMDLLLTGRRIGTEEALSLGLLTRLAPENELLDQAWDLCGQLAALDPRLAAAAKQSMLRGADLPLAGALQTEARLAAQALA